MSLEFKLPNIGEGVTEADIAEILVSVGDTVTANQTIMELETEKAVVELPSPQAGTIEKIHVKAGDSVQVGAVLVTLSDGAGSGKTHAAQPASKEQSPTEAKKSEASQPEKKAEVSPAAPSTEPETELVGGTVEFTLPPLGEGVSSADVAEILVSEGDVVEANAPIMELETEKAVVELPLPYSGKIKKIHVKTGDTVAVGGVVVTVETSSKVGKPASKPEAPAPVAAPAAASSAPAKQVAPAPAVQETAVAAPLSAEAEKDDGELAPAAPSTRRLARQLGVNLKNVQGSGRGGRITQDDVQAFVRTRLQQTANLPAKAAAAGTAISVGPLSPPPLPDFSKYGLVEREKLNKIARTAAENLTVAWQVIPHVTHHDRADITELENARKRFAAGVGKNGPKVTMTAIVMKALAKCLQIYPKFNSSLDPETFEVVYKRYFNIGCAVDTPNGLLVPVVKDCDKKNILEIANDLTDLATKARDRKLGVDSMQGATCTVTNLGGIGGIAFTPIVNYPEVCILGMSRGQSELRLIDGKVEERLMLPLSLSYDHRVINGADAARFVSTLCNLLTDPFQLLTTV